MILFHPADKLIKSQLYIFPRTITERKTDQKHYREDINCPEDTNQEISTLHVY